MQRALISYLFIITFACLQDAPFAMTPSERVAFQDQLHQELENIALGNPNDHSRNSLCEKLQNDHRLISRLRERYGLNFGRCFAQYGGDEFNEYRDQLEQASIRVDTLHQLLTDLAAASNFIRRRSNQNWANLTSPHSSNPGGADWFVRNFDNQRANIASESARDRQAVTLRHHPRHQHGRIQLFLNRCFNTTSSTLGIPRQYIQLNAARQNLQQSLIRPRPSSLNDDPGCLQHDSATISPPANEALPDDRRATSSYFAPSHQMTPVVGQTPANTGTPMSVQTAIRNGIISAVPITAGGGGAAASSAFMNHTANGLSTVARTPRPVFH